MVRYARSKGSKASNERRVEEATSWREMRSQLIAAQNKVFQKVDGSVDDVKDKQHERKISTIWAPIDVPERKGVKKLRKQSILDVKPKKNKSMQSKVFHEVEYTASDGPHEREVSNSWAPINYIDIKRVPNSKKHTFPSEDEFVKLKKKKFHDFKTKTHNSRRKDIATSKMPTEENITCEIEAETSPRIEKVEHNPRTKPQSLEMKLGNFSEGDEIHSLQGGSYSKNNKLKENISKFEQEYNKLISEESVKQRKRSVPTMEFIGGREVEIHYFDGFPVMKEDRERLMELKDEMIQKGVPENEMKAALKLERRRAEKALSRQRKKVCFNCRDSGHLLSECPSLNGFDPFSRKKGNITEIGNAEVCFKCGSTEHSYLKCKLGEKDNFKFASCFICGEQGHISRQCSENPRGVYPKGGACRTCGDVTHLRRDCPIYQQEQKKDVTTLPTLKDEAALEDLEVDTQKEKVSRTVKPVKKVVKF